jgi:hypothetical protein
MNSFRSQRGNAMMVVLILSIALLIVSAAFFRSMTVTRRLSHRSELLLQAREGGEAALGYATAELNKNATSLASLGEDPLPTFTLGTPDQNFLAGSGTNTNIVASSLGVKVGMISQNKKDMNLYANDPAYAGDQSAGVKLAVRSGLIYAKASAKDPLTGLLTTSYLSGVVQVREQTWLNFGMFYNMDMEFYAGATMDVKGAVHTNADLFLCAAGATTSFYQKITSAGHIYRGFKYLATGYNVDGTAKGFANVTSGTGALSAGTTGSANDGHGGGTVKVSTDGTLGGMITSSPTMDCLGSTTNPTTNNATWTALQADPATYNKNVLDMSMAVTKFTPPDLPLYVPEDYSTTAVTELRNHGYAMLEPQLPATDNTRYYGRKTDQVENLKFSALAGWTIVVEDLDLVGGGVTTLAASENGYAIPWKLVWYEGATVATQPLSKTNLPKRDATTRVNTSYSIDPFAKNDEVDFSTDLTNVALKMRRNLKALLRDAIVVVPYRDSGAGVGTFGTGAKTVTITGYPVNTAAADAVDCVFTPSGTTTRYNQPAGKYPDLNTADTATYWPILGRTTATPTYGANLKYPNNGTASSVGTEGNLNQTVTRYSGIYNRRQGYKSDFTNVNDALKGATHVVYIDLQKLNWIMNQSALWNHPVSGTAIYKFDESFTNLIYIDLPSAPQDTARFLLTASDKVCPAAKPSATVPGYAVLLDNGARLPRLPYDNTLRTPGLTIASNGPIYIRGNFNADGLTGTGDSVNPDTGSNDSLWYSSTHSDTEEIPAMIAADAVMFVTEIFNTKLSAQDSATANIAQNGDNGGAAAGALGVSTVKWNNYKDNGITTTPYFQEISAALILGLTPTIPWYYSTGRTSPSPIYANAVFNYSGGVNNLPRFAEKYVTSGGNAITVRYRGSLAALFESEVADGVWAEGKHGYWFSPPTRDWGYLAYFAEGMYPPGTPVIRSTRLIAIRDITKAEYDTGPAQQP